MTTTGPMTPTLRFEVIDGQPYARHANGTLTRLEVVPTPTLPTAPAPVPATGPSATYEVFQQAIAGQPLGGLPQPPAAPQPPARPDGLVAPRVPGHLTRAYNALVTGQSDYAPTVEEIKEVYRLLVALAQYNQRLQTYVKALYTFHTGSMHVPTLLDDLRAKWEPGQTCPECALADQRSVYGGFERLTKNRQLTHRHVFASCTHTIERAVG